MMAECYQGNVFEYTRRLLAPIQRINAAGECAGAALLFGATALNPVEALADYFGLTRAVAVAGSADATLINAMSQVGSGQTGSAARTAVADLRQFNLTHTRRVATAAAKTRIPWGLNLATSVAMCGAPPESRGLRNIAGAVSTNCGGSGTIRF